MDYFQYASRINHHRVSEIDTEKIKPKLRERYKAISNRLSQYDHWQGAGSPEEYWGSFIEHTSKRFFLNKYKLFCHDKKDVRRLADCLNKCDSRIILESLSSCSEKLTLELESYISTFIINTLLNFFFQNYYAFLNDSLLMTEWNELFLKNLSILEDSKNKRLLIENIDNLITDRGHFELLELFQKHDYDDLLHFVKKEFHSSNQFISSNFFHMALIQRSEVIYSSHDTTQKEIIDFIYTLISLKDRHLLLIGMVCSILKTRDKFSDDDFLKAQVGDIARIHIGNPKNNELWSSSVTNYTERIESARMELIKWQNEKIAIQYFEAMNFDIERKRFWLSSIRIMDEVKITIFEPHIRENYRLKQLFDENRENFIISEKSSTSSLLMKHKDYLFIEFSKHGNALYVYKSSSEAYKLFSRKRIINSTILKDGYPYKKIIHRLGWQGSVKSLLRSIR